MSVRIEQYLIYGIKFGEEFTNNHFNKSFHDGNEWFRKKFTNKPTFLTDGMNGNYTFFGFIAQLSNGWDEDLKEIQLDFTLFNAKDDIIISKFLEFYPNNEIKKEDIKLYYLPHWV